MIKSEPMWSYFGAVLPDSAGRIDEHRSKRRLVRGGWLFIDIIVDSGVTNHGALAQGKRVIIGEPLQSSSTFGREIYQPRLTPIRQDWRCFARCARCDNVVWMWA